MKLVKEQLNVKIINMWRLKLYKFILMRMKRKFNFLNF